MSAERQVELTSSAWLFNPERLFWIAGQINRDRPQNAKVGLELYPVVHKLPPLHSVPYLRNRQFVKDNRIAFERDGTISLDKIHNWWKEYGDGSQDPPVERIHLPFHYSIPSGLYNYFINSVFREKGDPKDRAIATAVAYMTMTAQNLFATRLAAELGAKLNAHVNIVEEAGKRGTITKTLGKNPTLVENDLDYPRTDPDQFETERDPKRAFAAVEKYGLHGVIYGADHAFRAGMDPSVKFAENQAGLDKHLRVIHISGSQGDHGLVTGDDRQFWEFMEFLKGRISQGVSFCLDLDPFQMDHLTKAQQVDYIRELVEKLESY